MDADPHGGQVRFRGMHLLESEREEDSGAGGFEGEEAAVAGPIDDSSLAALGELGYVLAVAHQQAIDGGVTMLGLESSRVNEVAERQG